MRLSARTSHRLPGNWLPCENRTSRTRLRQKFGHNGPPFCWRCRASRVFHRSASAWASGGRPERSGAAGQPMSRTVLSQLKLSKTRAGDALTIKLGSSRIPPPARVFQGIGSRCMAHSFKLPSPRGSWRLPIPVFSIEPVRKERFHVY